MSEKIEDHVECIKGAVFAAGVIDNYDMAGALERAKRALEVGPILDPTLWRDKRAALEQDIEILQAAIPLARVAERLQQKEPGNE